MSEKLFEEFPPVSPQVWADKVLSDLKGKDPSILRWKTPEGISLNPYYTQAVPVAVPKPPVGWLIHQDFPSSATDELSAVAGDSGWDSVGLSRSHATAEWVRLLHPEKAIWLNGFRPAQEEAEQIKKIIKDGADARRLFGGINWDLSRAVIHKRMVNYKVIADLLQTGPENFRVFSISGRAFSAWGADGLAEMAFVLSQLNEVAATLETEGADIRNIFDKAVVELSVGTSFFQEIARLRAMRLLLKTLADKWKAQDAHVHLLAGTSQMQYSSLDAHTNLLRSTTQAMSAVLGGCDRLSLTPFDVVENGGAAFSRRLARNIQLLLRDESFLGRVQDAGAGSWYLESVTAEYATRAWTLFVDMESKGGFSACVEQGFINAHINKNRDSQEAAAAVMKQAIVGVNKFASPVAQQANPIETGEFRLAAPFEQIRLLAEAAFRRKGERAKVYLLTFGDARMRRARAGFAQGVFGIAGYEFAENSTPDSPAEAISEIRSLKPAFIVFCSSDEEYPTTGLELLTELKKEGIPVFVAGKLPGGEAWQQPPVTGILFAGMNVVEFLSQAGQLMEERV